MRFDELRLLAMKRELPLLAMKLNKEQACWKSTLSFQHLASTSMSSKISLQQGGVVWPIVASPVLLNGFLTKKFIVSNMLSSTIL
jgi:hypothetical protein